MGTGRYKFDSSGGVKTATEVISDKSDLYQNRQRNALIVSTALIAMAQAAAFLDGVKTELTVTVDFDDSIIEDTNTTIDRNIKLVQAGLRSKLTAIMEINKCSRAEAEKELKLIAQDNQITGQDVDWTETDADNEEATDEQETEQDEEQGDVDEPSGESKGS